MDCDITVMWVCPDCGHKQEIHLHWMEGKNWTVCYGCKKNYWIKNKDLIKNVKVTDNEKRTK